ncbi:MAG: acyl carrier protein [Deltaproteobacteria bacterium]|nr:acyl carrier protein [Deltaproteobacteria bacterium]
MNREAENMHKRWTREEVEKTLKELLIDALSVDEDKIVPEASLVHDLGAESIDFLDIGFRVQQTFGVDLPNKAIQDKALSWRNLGELSQILEERYGARVAPAEMRQLHTMGIPEVLRWLTEKQGIAVQNGEAEKVAAELADRMAREVESIGFKASLIDKEGIVKLLLENLNSPKIMEGMIRLFSVGALVDFITARVGEEEVVNS